MVLAEPCSSREHLHARAETLASACKCCVMLGELRLDSASLQNELAEEALVEKALVVVTHAHFVDNNLQVIDGFLDEALAVLEELPPLVAGS